MILCDPQSSAHIPGCSRDFNVYNLYITAVQQCAVLRLGGNCLYKDNPAGPQNGQSLHTSYYLNLRAH